MALIKTNLHLFANKSKIEELKKQHIKTFHKRGSRGYVIMPDNSTKGTTNVADDCCSKNIPPSP